jgi:hypothetical protein
MSETRFVTAVNTHSYAGSPVLSVARSHFSVTGVTGFNILNVGVANEADAATAMADIAGDSAWTDIRVHDYESVAKAWVEARFAEHRDLPVHHIGQLVSEYFGQKLDAPAFMTRRDDLRVGDVYLSSHFGRTVVAETRSRAMTTTIIGSGLNQSEIYDRDSLVPVFESRVELVFRIEDPIERTE